MNILVVEDENSIAKLISEILETWGHRVQRSGTGSDALEKARRADVDLILLDISLPDIQGHELIPFFKASQPHVGIVAMTGSNSRELESKVRREGVIYYMIKPFELKVLKAVVDHVSKRRKSPSFSPGPEALDVRALFP
ncbi:MAG: response regulator [Deltaproteobacteria bacterium]|nr:response regulator [Deltaproteobacteria bacterium]